MLDNQVTVGSSYKQPQILCTVSFIGIVLRRRKHSHFFISEANFHLYRLNFFLASCTTINSVEPPEALHTGDAFPYILTGHASCSCCSRSDPGSPTAPAEPGGDPSPSLSFSFTIYKIPSEELKGFMYFSLSQPLEKAPWNGLPP